MPILLLAFRPYTERTSNRVGCSSYSEEVRVGTYATDVMCAYGVANIILNNYKKAADFEFKILDVETQLPEISICSQDIPDEFNYITTHELHDNVMAMANQIVAKQMEEEAKIAARVAEDIEKVKALITANPALAKEIKINGC